MISRFPSDQPRDRCRSCKKPIMWAVTEKGHRIPIDPEPCTDGNILLRARGHFVPPLAIVRFAIPVEETARFKSHFATCPQSSSWRKR